MFSVCRNLLVMSLVVVSYQYSMAEAPVSFELCLKFVGSWVNTDNGEKLHISQSTVNVSAGAGSIQQINTFILEQGDEHPQPFGIERYVNYGTPTNDYEVQNSLACLTNGDIEFNSVPISRGKYGSIETRLIVLDEKGQLFLLDRRKEPAQFGSPYVREDEK